MDLLQALGKDFNTTMDDFDLSMSKLLHSISAFKEAERQVLPEKTMRLLARGLATELKETAENTIRVAHSMSNAGYGILKELGDVDTTT